MYFYINKPQVLLNVTKFPLRGKKEASVTIRTVDGTNIENAEQWPNTFT